MTTAPPLAPEYCPLIIPRLRAIQERFGFLPDEHLRTLAEELRAQGRADATLARIEEIASFFPTFRRQWDPPAVIEVHVCRDYTCHRRGADELLERLSAAAAGDDAAPTAALIAKRLLARRVLRTPDGDPVQVESFFPDPLPAPLPSDPDSPFLVRATSGSALLDLVRHNIEVADRERTRRARESRMSPFPDPRSSQCRADVRGVSCLGRCDRAPVVWVERHPSPEGVSAWLVAGRGDRRLTTDDTAARVQAVVRQIASGAIPPAADGESAPSADDAEIVPSFRWLDRHDSEVVRPLDRSTSAPRPPVGEASNPHTSWTLDPCRDSASTYDTFDDVIKSFEGGGGVVRPWPVPLAEGLNALFPSLTADERSRVEKVVRSARPGSEAATRAQAELKERADRFVSTYNPCLKRLQDAGLRGMGGAGELTYDKWLRLWQQPGGRKYVVANGDESEPGTFKDREVMLHFAHLVVEGVILGGLLTGAAHGYVYVRHEYPEQRHALRRAAARALARLREAGGRFELGVLESPGGYICGEQSALVEVIEDKRAQPRSRPPELQANGLWNCPTVVNNVETFAWVPSVVRDPASADDYRARPRRLFSVSGDVRRPGVYEAPTALTLRELLENRCGGTNGELKAIAPSGPSGGLIPPALPLPPDTDTDFWSRVRGHPQWGPRLERCVDRSTGAPRLDVLKLPLDLAFFRTVNDVFRLRPGLALGGGLAFYAGGADVLGLAVNFTRFFRNESCGKCVPCRLGSQKLYQLGHDLLAERNPTDETRTDVDALTDALGQTAICGLGHVAGVPLRTALTYFTPNELCRPTAPEADHV
jgi:NADH:ubiquinone oxidoreductase subunit F (NADH-binding)/NADH:ubiquinone oxidoreductase subunit E